MPGIGNKSTFRFESHLPEVQAELRTGYRRNLTEAILIWQTAIKRALAGQRSGRSYKVPGTQIDHRASAPGEAPANLSGALRASYMTEVSDNALSAYLGSELDYSLHMERGTRHIEPRPAMEPSFRAVQGAITQALGRSI